MRARVARRQVVRRLATACIALALGASPLARADAPPAASAAELLDAEGTALMQAHRYTEACPKLAQSDRLEPGTGVVLRLGLCYQLSGKTASAWTAYREAAGRARRSGDDALGQLASKRAAALEPRLAKVTIRLASGDDADHVDVSCDGVRLDRSALGAEIPMDAGPHTLRASKPGRRAFAKSFVVADGDPPATIAIDLGAAPSVAPSPSRQVGPDTGDERADGGRPGQRQRAYALVVGGVGLAGIAVGTIFGLSAMSNWNRALSECTSGTSGCNSDALNRQSTVNGEALWSTVGFTVGAMGIVGAALLWWTAPTSSPSDRSSYLVLPAVDGRGAALDCVGRF